MGREYDDLDEEGQVEVLREVALAAAGHFGLTVDRLEVLLHGYNTTFRVDTTDTRTIALRVNTNSKSTPGQIRGQQAWQHALATQSDVRVPDPLRALNGDWFATAHSAALGRLAHATASSWLAGDDIATEVDVDQAHALGVAMATLHEHAEGWALPPNADLPTFDTPLFGDADRLTSYEGFDEEAKATVTTAMDRCTAAMERVCAGQRLIPLHADLHGGNLKWNGGRLSIFDFDDAGLSVPAVDLAISTFYLADRHGPTEAALREGYAQRRPLPALDRADFESVVASRQLLLANDILVSSTHAMRQQAADYAMTTIARLEGWLRTGVFTRLSAS
ncbi:phosphotransferase [Propioniciclava soli]|uniref:Phosphotransferase n=1 Tax=Propioniciclava soli TaxID=2775081 RepID=A0ABZ3C6K7_9ACTN